MVRAVFAVALGAAIGAVAVIARSILGVLDEH